MTDTAHDKTLEPSDTAEEPTEAERNDLFETLNRTLDDWRGRIDELMVQLDIGGMDVRGEIRTQLEKAQNAALAAQSRLADARSDIRSNFMNVVNGTRDVLADVKRAYDSAVAALRRD